MNTSTLGLHKTDDKTFKKTIGTNDFQVTGEKEKAATIAKIDLTEANSARHAISVVKRSY